MPKGIPKNGINIGRFKKTTEDVKKECLLCKKIFFISSYKNKRGGGKYCSYKCYRLMPSLLLKRVKITCDYCNKDIYRCPSVLHNKNYCNKQCFLSSGYYGMSGKKHSLETKEKMSMKGWSAMESWTKARRKIRKSSKYKEWVRKILDRDKHSCTKCGNLSKIEVDHIIPFRDILLDILHKHGSNEFYKKCSKDNKLLWNIDNGRSLCHSCHKETQTYGRKKLNNIPQTGILDTATKQLLLANFR